MLYVMHVFGSAGELRERLKVYFQRLDLEASGVDLDSDDPVRIGPLALFLGVLLKIFL